MSLKNGKSHQCKGWVTIKESVWGLPNSSLLVVSDHDAHKPVKEQQVLKVTSKPKKIPMVKKKEVKDTYSHPWLLFNLKGHSGEVLDLDFNSNGKQLGSCASDRSIMLWNVKAFVEKNPRSVRNNIEFDNATQIKWSPDSKAFILSLEVANTIQVYKVVKKTDGSLGNFEMILNFPTAHKADIINIGIACNGHFIMSCSSDTSIIVWDLKGQILATVDTLHINNYYACVSPCGRFIASSGFTPDVRVWEVCFSKTGEFKEVKRAFVLKGHTSGIYHFCFSNDSSRMLTTSKDGTWKLWDTNIEYSKGQEPYLLKTHSHGINSKCICALSPDGRTIAIASLTASDVFFYSSITGDLQAELKEIHPDPVRCMLFSPDGQYLIVAVGKHIRVFHNVPGFENIILGLEEAKRNATNVSMKDRLQSQILEAKAILNTFGKTS
ncbi:transducin beta-like protein 2 [Nephila pilipes]|uniref:Transducin beta-like protein 2 n=1 Tax=Nephila pilipes TaxID=299642 RepID=A0A8X6IRP2_NEPPI|nr:transducin beta-like protein 2 [Nephila pilipes]